MKYIRTNDENNLIIDLTNISLPYHITENGYIDFNRFGMFKIIKQADTIEELGDCFIAIDKNGNLCENPMIAKGHCFKSFCNYYKANGIDVDCYLAILTDKGLIYVAKMNSEGVVELL